MSIGLDGVYRSRLQMPRDLGLTFVRHKAVRYVCSLLQAKSPSRVLYHPVRTMFHEKCNASSA